MAPTAGSLSRGTARRTHDKEAVHEGGAGRRDRDRRARAAPVRSHPLSHPTGRAWRALRPPRRAARLPGSGDAAGTPGARRARQGRRQGARGLRRGLCALADRSGAGLAVRPARCRRRPARRGCDPVAGDQPRAPGRGTRALVGAGRRAGPDPARHRLVGAPVRETPAQRVAEARALTRFWRIWAAVLGASLMIGETIRSWGQGRNLLFVLDDFVIGIPLVLTAFLMARPSPARRCAFSAFAATAGMLYPSFFGKLVDLSQPASSNVEIGLLTGLIGAALLSSLVGLVASVYLAR